MRNKKLIALVLSALFLLTALPFSFASAAQADLNPAMTILVPCEEAGATIGWANVCVTNTIAEGVSPLGNAVKVQHKSVVENGENICLADFVLGGCYAPSDTSALDGGLAFWIKNDDVDLHPAVAIRTTGGTGYVKMTATAEWKLVSEDGSLSAGQLTDDSRLIIPANFTGWVILPGDAFQAAIPPSDMYSIGFSYWANDNMDGCIYIDSLGFYDDEAALLRSLGVKSIEPAMTILVPCEEADKTIGWSNAQTTNTIAEGVSPLGNAVKIQHNDGPTCWPEFVLGGCYAPADTSRCDAGMAFWIKAPANDHELDVSIRCSGDVGRINRKAGHAYKLVAEDGTVIDGQLTAVNRLFFPGGFTGWVILPSEAFEGDQALPSDVYGIGFNYDGYNNISESYYIDSIGFYDDEAALLASLGAKSDDNTGDDNTGDDNTGDDNSGDDNTGDDNTGDDNTGDDNTGDSGNDDQNPPAPTGPTMNSEENKEMWVVQDFSDISNAFVWTNVPDLAGFASNVPDGKGMYIHPQGTPLIEYCVKPNITAELADSLKNGEYTGFCFYYKAPQEDRGTINFCLFEEDGYRDCWSLDTISGFSTFYLLHDNGTWEERAATMVLHGFEGWIFIPFESFIYAWGNSTENASLLEPWKVTQIDINYDALNHGLDEMAQVYDDFAFYTNIDAVKAAMVPQPDNGDDNTGDDNTGDDNTGDADNNGGSTTDKEENKNDTSSPATGVTTAAPLALLIATAAGAVVAKTRKRR